MSVIWSFALSSSFLSNGISLAVQQQILTLLGAAGETWSRYLGDSSAFISVEVNVVDFPDDLTLAQAGPFVGVLDNTTYESGVAFEIRTGTDPNGSSFDAAIDISLDALQGNEFYFDPEPFIRDNPIPAGQIDFLSVALHELGHPLGFVGESDWKFYRYVTAVSEDDLRFFGTRTMEVAFTSTGVRIDPESAHFLEGARVRAFGNSVPVLMDPVLEPGRREFITPLDTAVLYDLGIAVPQATSGDDVIYGYDSLDFFLSLGDGSDWYSGGWSLGSSSSRSGVHIRGGAGDDTLIGSRYSDSLEGDSENDLLRGLEGNDQLLGHDGNDTLEGSSGADNLNGGSGIDWAVYEESPSGVGVSLDNNASFGGEAAGDVFSSIENIRGSSFSDTLTGDGSDNVLMGDAAPDLLYGMGGDDTLEGGLGNDTIEGGFGNDILDGGEGNDIGYGGNGFDAVHGGEGTDNFAGEGGNDRLFGDGGNDMLFGDIGFDRLDGGEGNDNLTGGGGNDTLRGANGADLLNGDDGNDRIFGGVGADTINGGVGADQIRSEAGNDVVTGGGGNDRIFGSFGFDDLNGGNENDLLDGNGGNDTLVGGNGEDTLIGNFGFDSLRGGANDDILQGASGNDTVTGGGGNDTFVFNIGDGNDRITDFATGAGSDDVIALSGFGAGFDEFSEILAAATQSGSTVIIDFGGGDMLRLANTNLTDLHQDDFVFG